MPHRLRILLFAVIPVFLIATGCNSNLDVSGRVTFKDGDPLPKGVVTFQSDKHVATGILDENGRYRLGSYKKNDGIPAGTYKVFISGAYVLKEPGSVEPESDEPADIPLIDESYATWEKTPLSCDVTKKTTYDFEVEPYAKKR